MPSEQLLYCEALDIVVPRLEFAKDSPDANYFALLIVALLEHGGPVRQVGSK